MVRSGFLRLRPWGPWCTCGPVLTSYLCISNPSLSFLFHAQVNYFDIVFQKDTFQHETFIRAPGEFGLWLSIPRHTWDDLWAHRLPPGFSPWIRVQIISMVPAYPFTENQRYPTWFSVNRLTHRSCCPVMLVGKHQHQQGLSWPHTLRAWQESMRSSGVPCPDLLPGLEPQGRLHQRDSTYPGPWRMIKEKRGTKDIRGKGTGVYKVMEVPKVPVRCSGRVGAELWRDTGC